MEGLGQINKIRSACTKEDRIESRNHSDIQSWIDNGAVELVVLVVAGIGKGVVVVVEEVVVVAVDHAVDEVEVDGTILQEQITSNRHRYQ